MQSRNSIILFGYGSFGRELYINFKRLQHDVKVVSSIDEHVEFALSEQIDITKINIKRDEDILSLNIDAQKSIIYCAMSSTANNLFLVLTLRTLYKDAVIVAISNSFENSRKLLYAGANNIIDLYEATSRRTVNILSKPAVTRALDEIIYKNNELKMAEVVVKKGSFIDNRYISEINFKAHGVVLIAIIDKELNNELHFADFRIDHKIDEDDILVIVAKKEELENFKKKVAH